MIQIAPPNPSSSDDVVISASYTGCVHSSGMVRVGDTFTGHIEYQPQCFSVPPTGSVSFPVGKLDPGNYTVTVESFFIGGPVIPAATQTAAFLVSPSASMAVPTLEPLALALTVVLIVLVQAFRAMRR